MSSSPPSRVVLDTSAVAPPRPEVLEAAREAWREGWSEPSGLHSEARQAAALLSAARQAVAEALGARSDEVHFTATPVTAAHGAVAALAHGRRRVGRRIVVSAVERAAVLAAAHLAAGDDVTTVPVDQHGRVDAEAMSAALREPGVALAALQHANGEVGTLQPVAEVHAVARAHGVPLLVDAGASLGRVAVGQSWDVLTANPSAWGGPVGVGLLVVRTGVRALLPGPEDADPFAPGGVSVPAAFGAAVGLRAALAAQDASDRRLRAIVDRLRAQVPAQVPDVDVVGDPGARLPHVVTFSFLYVDGEALLGELDRAGFAVGSGSACTSLSLEPSHVLAAMGALTHGNIRIALHDGVTDDDVERFLATLPRAVAAVRERLGVSGL